MIVDQATFDAWVGGNADGTRPDVDVDARRCETVDGVQVARRRFALAWADRCAGW